MPGVSAELREECVETLRAALRDGEQWVKVHAAEQLLALGYPQGVRETFEAERQAFEAEPQYRIGIWRVLARAAVNAEVRDRWIDEIRQAFLDPKGPDRLHAIETLAKLGYMPAVEDEAHFAQAAQDKDGRFAGYARWILAQAGKPEAEALLTDLLDSEEAEVRSTAAYALRHLGAITAATRQRLLVAAEEEAPDSPARIHLVAAALLHAPNAEAARPFREAVCQYAREGEQGQRYQAVQTLAACSRNTDVPLLEGLLEDPDMDVRACAAYAILRAERRVEHRLGALDWMVIALYALGMIAVGIYYARRTVTTEDYLLGGRNMRPLAVGLSMFATLLSTISYLAVPGEMIKHGPMVSGQYFVYPLIFLVIGFLLIPYIMRFKVISAYEILEIRLGLSVRMLGSFIFLGLRLLWMSVIIYATSNKILIPMLGWDASATPVVCAALGILTIIYTSMGGLRAVVMTDVIQTVILFGGAMLTLALITYNMGGVTAWWPKEWAPNWDPLRITYGPTARITIMNMMTAAFVWHVCTAGSDQVALQRYFATCDVRAARRVVATSLTCDVCVGLFLAVLGLGLFAFFSSNPHMLPDGQQVYTNADRLFPRFIVMGLPAGLSGLVLAGLLAAAMSSLSSGVNSSCSVISVDFIDRFRRSKKAVSEAAHLRRAKWISVAVGVVVVLLSIGVNRVSGNLLEIAYKVVNLFTAPLFVLFFMAMFVPWATSAGTIIAGVCSVAMAIGIAYFGWFGLSFIWIMPLSLLTGMIVGPLVSMAPLGRKPA